LQCWLQRERLRGRLLSPAQRSRRAQHRHAQLLEEEEAWTLSELLELDERSSITCVRHNGSGSTVEISNSEPAGVLVLLTWAAEPAPKTNTSLDKVRFVENLR